MSEKGILHHNGDSARPYGSDESSGKKHARLLLTRTYGLGREEAYVLCSVAVDPLIHEVVDQPNWIVDVMIPLDIYP
jgi:hypothetical protein